MIRMIQRPAFSVRGQQIWMSENQAGCRKRRASKSVFVAWRTVRSQDHLHSLKRVELVTGAVFGRMHMCIAETRGPIRWIDP